MTDVPVSHGLFLAGILFLSGMVGVLVRRNVIFMLISIEIMLNATGMAFIVAGSRWTVTGGAVGSETAGTDGQVMFLFILTMSAAEVSVALALILQIHRRYRTLDADAVDSMRG